MTEPPLASILQQAGTQHVKARLTRCSDRSGQKLKSSEQTLEYVMRIHIPCTTLGFLLAAAAPAAHAQTIYTQQPDGTVVAQDPVVTVPAPTVVTQPAQTVTTVTTVQTERPVARRRVVVTRQTTVRDRIVRPTQTLVALTVANVTPGPLYDVVAPAAPAAPGTAVPFYRYVYESDRILVIDPATGIAVQAIPR
jgi:hypothetical protein